MSDIADVKRMLAAVQTTVVGVGICLFAPNDVLLVGIGSLLVLVSVVVVAASAFPSGATGNERDTE
ncbi:hypothetical protein [Halobaculum lipolyticum]|uniref:Holin n=1 Tax=Halobaculum lipolyticum TaxID=3032001 RepID=A0ABD5WDU5_9EURY|nr:hypothetical protein [Halobaculum sp. DT31]